MKWWCGGINVPHRRFLGLEVPQRTKRSVPCCSLTSKVGVRRRFPSKGLSIIWPWMCVSDLETLKFSRDMGYILLNSQFSFWTGTTLAQRTRRNFPFIVPGSWQRTDGRPSASRQKICKSGLLEPADAPCCCCWCLLLHDDLLPELIAAQKCEMRSGGGRKGNGTKPGISELDGWWIGEYTSATGRESLLLPSKQSRERSGEIATKMIGVRFIGSFLRDGQKVSWDKSKRVVACTREYTTTITYRTIDSEDALFLGFWGYSHYLLLCSWCTPCVHTSSDCAWQQLYSTHSVGHSFPEDEQSEELFAQ